MIWLLALYAACGFLCATLGTIGWTREKGDSLHPMTYIAVVVFWPLILLVSVGVAIKGD